ncbi:MAG: hypothetical protein JSR18_14250 [Proteobacteria bacterium]|nr:hypothetical protein [Pseudomonadota bacterium]
MSDVTTHASPPAPPPLRRRDVVTGSVVALAALLVVLVAYTLAAAPGPWLSLAGSRAWPGSAMKLVYGIGGISGDTLVVTAPGEARTIVAALDVNFATGDYPGVQWQVEGLPADADVRTVFRTSVSRTQNLAPVRVEAGQARPVVLAGNAAWNGRATGLALAIRLANDAPLAVPIRIHGVRATTMDARATVADRVREWYTFEPFNGTTINTLTGGADSQSLPLPLLAATVAALAALALFALHRYAPSFFAVRTLAAVGTVFVVAWLAVDVRLGWNLALQVRDTVARYGSLDPEARHRAAEDADLYAFIQAVRAKLPASGARVFVGADEHYFRGRAAYHLYPFNVQFTPFVNTLAPAAWMHAGDWIVVYHRSGMAYDAAQRRLRWDGGTIGAELVLGQPDGAALFKVTGP